MRSVKVATGFGTTEIKQPNVKVPQTDSGEID